MSGLTIDADNVRAHVWQRAILPAVAGNLVEQQAYVALNTFHGQRGGDSRLAALNALWLDLDINNVADLSKLGRSDAAAHISRAISQAGIPAPSFLIDSGRGFYCLWLLSDSASAALPHWNALMRALTDWAQPLGADPACVDAARVLRLPGS